MDLRHTDVVKSVDRTGTLPVAGSGGDARGASGVSDACTGAARGGLPEIAGPGPATPPKAGPPGPATPPKAGPGSAAPSKPAVPASGTAGAVTYLGSERGTRARIARLILENGPVTAAGL